MARVGVAANDLDLILLATITPDTACPSGACWLQAKLGACRAVAFDVVAACSGFIFGLSVADQYLHAGAARTVPLVAADRQGRIRPGDLVLLAAFGGGLAWGSALIRW
jgi:3-oxoacyl-[acyl-carrier-protein] synthase-3